MADWPWPNDTKEERHRRIIDTYRTALLRVDEPACRDLDEQLAAFGQGWVVGTLVGNDELKTAQEITALLDLNPWDIKNWSDRYPDQIPKRGKRGNKYLYRVGDVNQYRASLKRGKHPVI